MFKHEFLGRPNQRVTDWILAHRTLLYGTVDFILSDGSEIKISLPTFGSMLGLRSTYNNWLPEVLKVFPSSNASKLQLVIINDSEITLVRRYGFYNISNLKTVKDLKGTVMSIGSYAFRSCSSLTVVSFPACTSIGDYAFQNCYSLTTAYFPVCMSIGPYAFEDCSSLTTISFPACTSIGNDIFTHCSKLSRIYVSNSTLHSIDNGYGQVDQLVVNNNETEIKLATPVITQASNSTITLISSNAFCYCRSLTTVSFPACTSIGEFAFEACTSLTTASFPACTYIDEYAFTCCDSLTTASFPACTSIGSSAFEACTSLTTVSFPVCTYIGEYAFYFCTSLTAVSFPACTSIGFGAFEYCETLANIFFLGSSIPSLPDSNVFDTLPTYYNIFVQPSMLTAFQTAPVWRYISSHIVAYF